MPILDNPRHERFAHGLAKGKSQAEAYGFAGYRGDETAACRLSRNVKVQQRVAELQERAAIRTEVTIESLTRELDEARALAAKIEQPAAMVAASREKAVLHGLRVEKRENLNRDVTDVSDEELVALARAGCDGAVAPSSSAAKPH